MKRGEAPIASIATWVIALALIAIMIWIIGTYIVKNGVSFPGWDSLFK